MNDAKKYAVTEVRVRVLAANYYSPHFEKPQFQAFVHEGESVASLVLTYSGRVLLLNAADLDFPDVSLCPPPDPRIHPTPALRSPLSRQDTKACLKQCRCSSWRNREKWRQTIQIC